MRKILITGAGSGLGRGTAVGLAQAGHQVIAATQIWPQVTELRRHVAELGPQDRITVDKLDVLDARDLAAAFSWDFDTLVSNAAVGDSGPMAEIPVDLVRRTFETNVFSNLELTQRVIRKFVDTGTAGRIMAGQFDPQDMIDRMVSVIGAEDGTYRYVWPPANEDLVKQAQEGAWTRKT
ncbi:SDR family NAD(P)-dependent oxidoreductase [Streptomyces mirabilis]|uniref:SDR family NAD(P)-dependent oxidoreductase n=1 Tax=Streptomyces mirabilis TaxID=68239 RepID=UPI00343E52D7